MECGKRPYRARVSRSKEREAGAKPRGRSLRRATAPARSVAKRISLARHSVPGFRPLRCCSRLRYRRSTLTPLRAESDEESTYSCQSSCSLEIPHKCTRRYAPPRTSYVHIASEGEPGTGVPHRSEPAPTTIGSAASAAARYVKTKMVEGSVFPDLSLPHMSASQLEVRRPQRRFVRSPPPPEQNPERVTVKLEGGRPRLWNRHYTQTVEEMEEECGRKRAAFREELNRSRWLRKQGYILRPYRNLEPLVQTVKLQERRVRPPPTKCGDVVEFDRYSRGSFPWMTTLLVLILLVVYAIDKLDSAASTWLKNNWQLTIAPKDHNLKCLRDGRLQVWRFVTYQFLHLDNMHLFSNCGVIIVLGGMFEWTHGHVNFTVLFQMGVIAGALTAIIINPRTIVMGASGGAYAMGGAHLANIFVNYNTMAPLLRWLRILVFAVFLLCEVLPHVGVPMTSRDVRNVSHEAHYGGFTLAAFLGLSFTDNLVMGKWDKYLRPCGILLAAGFAIAGIILISLHDPSTCVAPVKLVRTVQATPRADAV